MRKALALLVVTVAASVNGGGSLKFDEPLYPNSDPYPPGRPDCYYGDNAARCIAGLASECNSADGPLLPGIAGGISNGCQPYSGMLSRVSCGCICASGAMVWKHCAVPPGPRPEDRT